MPPRPKSRGAFVFLFLLLVIGLRLFAPDSDPPSYLSWSSGLLTDEGFYLSNARNGALFGQERLDEWNNALIMPILHGVQKGVFAVCGVGIVQARAISVVLSLLVLLFFFDALQRTFGQRAAWLGVVFLGLDHTVLLYNRMALMDTPGAFVLTAAFWAWVRGTETRTEWNSKTASVWLIASGILMGLAYATRGLALIAFPVPLLVLWRQNRRLCGAYIVGLTLFFCVYVPAWYLPHRAEIGQMGRFYLSAQMLPHSLNALRLNLLRMLWGERGGNAFYLLHSPVLWLCAIGAVCRRKENSLAYDFLRLWLGFFFVLFAVFSYAPSRYYVLSAPAVTALAAITIDGLLNAVRWRKAAMVLCAVWGVINAAWLGNWLLTLRWTQRDAERWLVAHLPANSMLIGDAAPALSINTKFRAVNVQLGLCNDTHPLERYTGKPCYVVMINGSDNRAWLQANAPPTAVSLTSFPDVVGFEVVVYRVSIELR